MKKQTAVEWLVEAIQKQIDSGYGFDPRFDEKIINQFKEMEQTNSIEKDQEIISLKQEIKSLKNQLESMRL